MPKVNNWVKAALLLLGLSLLVVLTGCTSSRSDIPKGDPPPAPYYVHTNGVYQQQLRTAAAQADDPADAARLNRMADMSWATWWNNESDLDTEINGLLTGAQLTGQKVLIVSYRVPGRDCGSYSNEGTSANNEEFLQGIRKFVDRVAETGQPVDFLFEPDAIAHMADPKFAQCQAEHPDRLDLFREAVGILKSKGNIQVLLDGGAPGWVQPDPMRAALVKAGLPQADGVIINTANTMWTAESVSFGQDLIRDYPGKRVMVDTSRNGLGPYKDGPHDWAWCNPPGRAFGPYPGTKAKEANVSFAWIKLQGQSDGECDRAAPPNKDTKAYKAGIFVPAFANEIAKKSGW